MAIPTIPRSKRTTKIPLPEAIGGETQVSVPARLPSLALQTAESLALSALIGGNLFGRVAMSPALAKISDKSERGKVLNSSWRRYGTVNSLSLAVLIGSWLPTRQEELAGLWVRKGDRRMVLVKDITVGAVTVTGLAAAVAGMGFAHEAPPEGAVPMEDGSQPAPEAPKRAARIKQAVNQLGALNLAAEVALVAANVALLQRRTRRLLGR